MKRDNCKQLVSWKLSSSRKPLVLKGARQVGKTYILKKFGKGEYGNVAYFNFEEDPDLNEIFTGRLSPEKIGVIYIAQPLDIGWCARLESNRRSSAPEADALSPRLRAHIYLESTLSALISQVEIVDSNSSFASPTTYNDPAIQIASFGDVVLMAYFTAFPTSGIICISLIMSFAVK